MNPSRPFFSIIIPTSNSAQVVGSAIQSVLSQQFTDFEVLIIDGMSNDNTTEIASYYRDERVKVTSEKDTGIYDAMNKGVLQSKGQWLMFLGSDDRLYNPSVLHDIHEFIADHPLSKFIYGDVVTSMGGIQSYRNYTYLKLLDMCICHQAIFYHRSLFSKMLYDTRFRVCGDWDFNLKVFRRKNQPVHVNKTIAIFNVTGASNNWINHPEYNLYFRSKTKSILRYRGIPYLLYYYFSAILMRLKYRTRRSSQNLQPLSGSDE